MDFGAFSIAKGIHLIGIFIWIPSLLILGRLFIFHSEALENGLPIDAALAKRFTQRQLQVLHWIASPSGLLSILSGLAMIMVQPVIMERLWLHLLTLLVVPILYFHVNAYQYSAELADPNLEKRGVRYFKLISEVMVWPSIIVVILIIVLRDTTL